MKRQRPSSGQRASGLSKRALQGLRLRIEADPSRIVELAHGSIFDLAGDDTTLHEMISPHIGTCMRLARTNALPVTDIITGLNNSASALHAMAGALLAHEALDDRLSAMVGKHVVSLSPQQMRRISQQLTIFDEAPIYARAIGAYASTSDAARAETMGWIDRHMAVDADDRTDMDLLVGPFNHMGAGIAPTIRACLHNPMHALEFLQAVDVHVPATAPAADVALAALTSGLLSETHDFHPASSLIMNPSDSRAIIPELIARIADDDRALLGAVAMHAVMMTEADVRSSTLQLKHDELLINAKAVLAGIADQDAGENR